MLLRRLVLAVYGARLSLRFPPEAPLQSAGLLAAAGASFAAPHQLTAPSSGLACTRALFYLFAPVAGSHFGRYRAREPSIFSSSEDHAGIAEKGRRRVSGEEACRAT